MVATGEEWEKQIVRKIGMDMNTLTYLKWITNKVLLCKTQNSVNPMGQPAWEESLGEDGYM